MSRPSSDVLPRTRSGTRAEIGTALLVLAMLLWSTAAGLVATVLLADSSPYGVGPLSAIVIALLAAACTVVGGLCTRGALPRHRLLGVALLVPVVAIGLSSARQERQEQRQRDCPSLIGFQPHQLDEHGRCVPAVDVPAATPAE